MPTWKFEHPGGGDLAIPAGVEVPDAWVWVDVVSRNLAVAEGDLWDPAGADAEIYRVMFIVVNNSAAPVTGIHIGRDPNSAGALASPYYWMHDETIPRRGDSGWCGPFYMHGDDAIRGYSDLGAVASIFFDVRRVL